MSAHGEESNEGKHTALESIVVGLENILKERFGKENKQE